MRYKKYCRYERAEEDGRRERDADLHHERKRLKESTTTAGPDVDSAESQALRDIEDDPKTTAEIRNRYVPTGNSEAFAQGELTQDPKALLKALSDEFIDAQSQNPSKYRRGAIVRHDRLGRGEVLDTESRGGRMLIRVRLERDGPDKWLVAEYADLDVL